jgi:hypothetical protein
VARVSLAVVMFTAWKIISSLTRRIQRVEQPYSELQNQLQNQNQLFVDESPTKENKAKA